MAIFKQQGGSILILIGHKAPDFTAPAYLDGKFTDVSLASYAGKWLVIMFTPAHFTFVLRHRSLRRGGESGRHSKRLAWTY
jgi:hypothetical protein